MIIIGQASGFSDWELGKLNEADALADQVLVHAAFESLVLSARRLDGGRGFENTVDSPEETLAKYRSGDIVLTVSIYTPSWWHRFSSEVAHESPDGSISFNSRFYDNMDAPSRVNTLFHETGHKIGYEHDYLRTARRPFSEPYQVGDIAEKVARLILAGHTSNVAQKVAVESLV